MKRQLLHTLFLACCVATLTTSCSNANTSKSTTTEDSTIAQKYEEITLNPFFLQDTDNLLEYANGKCVGGSFKDGIAKRTVKLNKNTSAEIRIHATDSSMASVVINNKKYNLDYGIVSIKAMELDGDGELELVTHNGDLFEATIYKLKGEKLVKCGLLNCNCGLWKTKYNTIVARMGETGHATISRLKDYKLYELENFYIPQALFASQGFEDMEYIFDSQTNPKLKPIYQAAKYATGKEEDIVLTHDFDKNGDNEQVIFHKADRGLTQNDELLITSNNKLVDFLLPAIIGNEDNDIDGITRDVYNCQVTAQIQLSAIDYNNDGKDELIVTIGTKEKNNSFLFIYTKGHIELTKHL